MEPKDLQKDIEVLAHVHLRKEQVNMGHALQAISDWVRSGTNEGANFLITRLTGPIGEGSLFGGADISRFAPGGLRGSLDSQGGHAYFLDFSGGSPSRFRLAYVQKLAAPHGPTYFFDTEKTTDEAVYSFTVVLL